MKALIQIEELVCPMCGGKIENALKKEAGVKSCSVAYPSGKARVEFDENVTDAMHLKEVIEKLGYVVEKIK